MTVLQGLTHSSDTPERAGRANGYTGLGLRTEPTRPGMWLLTLRRPPRTGAALLRQRHGSGGVKPPRRRVHQASADIERGLADTERRGKPPNVPAK